MTTTATCTKHKWEFSGQVLTCYPGLYVMYCAGCGARYDMPENEYQQIQLSRLKAALETTP